MIGHTIAVHNGKSHDLCRSTVTEQMVGPQAGKRPHPHLPRPHQGQKRLPLLRKRNTMVNQPHPAQKPAATAATSADPFPSCGRVTIRSGGRFLFREALIPA